VAGTAGGVRVRFAPSPTGYFHVGSARTALFNWLFARREGGVFVLRIEDTDQERGREEWVEGILSAMSWLGLVPDEGPYRQSERREAYQAAIEKLWAGGFLYACSCTRAEVEERTKGRPTPGYDGHCRELGLPRQANALRFRVPDSGATVVHDVVRGEVEFPHGAIEDFVVAKSSGDPLFVLANVVDDIDMRITHVIRGEDLLPSTPKAVLVWRALMGPDSPLPIYAHLPMLVNEKRQKLSKRRDPVALEAYREQGYLPEAMVNYLALLGWSHPSGREILSVKEMVESFRLEDVNHAPAFFDVAKLTHMNAEYIRSMSVEGFVQACRPWLEPPRACWRAERFDPEVFRRIAPLVQERVSTLSEVPSMVDFIFLEDPPIDEEQLASLRKDERALVVLEKAIELYADCDWSSVSLHELTRDLAESLGMKLAKAQAPIRLALTGRRVGPPLFESMELVGRDETLRRLGHLRTVLKAA
jgi:glutamyl-tRNA synthetase